MSRATKALAALAALAASASAAYPPAAANCSRHIRVGVFDDANPLAVAFLGIVGKLPGNEISGSVITGNYR
jgi:hypothetical protein